MLLGVVALMAGVLMVLVGAALTANYRQIGDQTAQFGGGLTFTAGGADALRRRRRTARVWGSLLMLLGLGWIVGGIVLIAA